MQDRATIFALSSGRGRAGVAVIRVSGAAAGRVLERMAPPRPQPRYAGLRRIRHPVTAEPIDQGLVLWLPGPRSETGEDCAELQVHGGPAVVRAVLTALACIEGCRPAEAGEFARRAFESGKLDLTAVEGLADLIDAETEAQRRQALGQAGGALARLCEGWRERALTARALAEAAIDFSDEGDVAEDALAQARREASLLAQEIGAHLDDGHRGEIIREGFRVVLAGAPNAGKSSLLNALARRDVAIVSPEPGTTRDVIEVRLDLGGYAVVLADTAGIREATGAVELEGIRRTVERARGADLVLWLVDATAPAERPTREIEASGVPVATVLNKIDLVPETARRGSGAQIAISAATGAGLGELAAWLGAQVAARAGAGDGAVLTQARHRQALVAAREALGRFLAGPTGEAELRAEDLRVAADALGHVVGRIAVEDVLGQIFGRFCIGK